ncbi:hypothetical protein [Nocardia nova]|uniref:hypothetical protein n=1 Tax=Nocardia nova TaxID=37330 RepID=UPI0018930B05|nr:hypothetical protein [Nocardia nova]MBF6150272.1 hypothetical protein [Nocardia nova]
MANYNLYAHVVNNTSNDIKFSHVCKGTDEKPTEGQKGKLYHGEIVGKPTDLIRPGAVGTFTAKSTGETVQGTAFYEVPGNTGDTWMYFHVPDYAKRHKQSENVKVEVSGTTHDKVVTYTINKMA